MDKPGNWFLLENGTLPQVFFKHFASKNQLPGFCISGTLVEKGLIRARNSAYHGGGNLSFTGRFYVRT